MKKHWLLTVTLLLTALTAWIIPLSLSEELPRKEVLMGVSNGVITAPINAQDPYICMGVGKYNGWWDIAYICSNRHGKTNIWAKYKPMDVPKFEDLTDTDRGKVKYGINIVGVDPYEINIKDDSAWSYSPPTTHFRLNDFYRYNHYCVPPFSWGIPNYVNLNRAELGFVLLDVDSDLSDMPLYNVNFFDVLSTYYASWYPGVIFYNVGYNDYVVCSGSKTVGEQVTGGREIPIPEYIRNNWSDSDEVYAYGIISAIKFTGENAGGLERGTAFYVSEKENNGFTKVQLAYENEMEGKIGMQSLSLTYTDSGNNDYIITTITAVITNSSGRTFTGCSVYGYFEGEDGMTFPIRTSPNHTIYGSGQTTIRIEQTVNVHAPSDGIIRVFLTTSSSLGDSDITSSRYNLKTNTWIK